MGNSRAIICIVVFSLVLSCFPALVRAQPVQTGPNFYLGGFQIAQLSIGDSRFDPYVVNRTFYRIDPPEREGLVDTRITIREDGTVSKVELLGGFYDAKFLDEALNGIRGSTFRPAMQGSEAVAWPHLDMRILLRGYFTRGVSLDVSSGVSDIQKQIADQDYAGAEMAALSLLAEDVQLLSEMALVQLQLALIYSKTDRTAEALLASRLATGQSRALIPIVPLTTRISKSSNQYPDHFLAADLYLPALQKHVLTALALNQTGEALEVFETLQSEAALRGAQEQIAGVAELVEGVRKLLSSGEPVSSAVRLVQGNWSFTMSNRRVFGISGLAGKVEFIDVNCKNSNKRRMQFNNDIEFRIPDSWGQCKLEFRGDDGSTFILSEFLN